MNILEFIRAAAALALTLGLVGLGAALLRRYGPEWMARLQKAQDDRRLHLVETLTLDPNRRLVLVRLDDEERLILLGEGQLLAVRPSAPPAAEESQA
jgi:flagellar protein FliO/FliZ